MSSDSARSGRFSLALPLTGETLSGSANWPLGGRSVVGGHAL